MLTIKSIKKPNITTVPTENLNFNISIDFDIFFDTYSVNLSKFTTNFISASILKLLRYIQDYKKNCDPVVAVHKLSFEFTLQTLLYSRSDSIHCVNVLLVRGFHLLDV